MNTLPKRVPRLWCARLGLLPLAGTRAVGSVAMDRVRDGATKENSLGGKGASLQTERNGIADAPERMNARPGGPLRNQS